MGIFVINWFFRIDQKRYLERTVLFVKRGMENVQKDMKQRTGTAIQKTIITAIYDGQDHEVTAQTQHDMELARE
jgi:hypothetical protein